MRKWLKKWILLWFILIQIGKGSSWIKFKFPNYMYKSFIATSAMYLYLCTYLNLNLNIQDLPLHFHHWFPKARSCQYRILCKWSRRWWFGWMKIQTFVFSSTNLYKLTENRVPSECECSSPIDWFLLLLKRPDSSTGLAIKLQIHK